MTSNTEKNTESQQTPEIEPANKPLPPRPNKIEADESEEEAKGYGF